MPLAEVFPSVDAEFVKKRHGMLRRYSGMESSVGGIELLIAASAGAGVMNNVSRIAVEIRIAGIDPAKIREQRNDPAVLLIDAIPRPMDGRDRGPRDYFSRLKDFC